MHESRRMPSMLAVKLVMVVFAKDQFFRAASRGFWLCTHTHEPPFAMSLIRVLLTNKHMNTPLDGETSCWYGR